MKARSNKSEPYIISPSDCECGESLGFHVWDMVYYTEIFPTSQALIHFAFRSFDASFQCILSYILFNRF